LNREVILDGPRFSRVVFVPGSTCLRSTRPWFGQSVSAWWWTYRHILNLIQWGEEIRKMETKQKMAISGAGLIIAGIGLGIVGTALLLPAAFAWTTRLVEKGADGFNAKVEGASKTVGKVAGTLHRSFNEAKRAGLAEIKRSRSNDVAG